MPSYSKVKRLVDVILACLFLAILSPLFFVISLLVWGFSGMPIIFRHKRYGKDGAIISVLKFRSMKRNAEEAIADFTPEQQKEWRCNFRLDDDPRVTRIGTFLRATKLDELPQLINVIRGEMSLVGPRPVISEEVELYGDNKQKFLSIRPGITGYWQIYASPQCTYEERMRMELEYVDGYNWKWDARILFATVVKMLGLRR